MARRLTVRPARAEDRAFVDDLGARTVDASRSGCRDVPDALLRASYERLLAIVYDQSHVALIAASGEERLGFLVMLDRMPDEVTGMPQGFVAYMAVEPSARREGIGTVLLFAAEEEARRRGLPHVSLMVTEENDAARGFYERAGYVTERRLLCKSL